MVNHCVSMRTLTILAACLIGAPAMAQPMLACFDKDAAAKVMAGDYGEARFATGVSNRQPDRSMGIARDGNVYDIDELSDRARRGVRDSKRRGLGTGGPTFWGDNSMTETNKNVIDHVTAKTQEIKDHVTAALAKAEGKTDRALSWIDKSGFSFVIVGAYSGGLIWLGSYLF